LPNTCTCEKCLPFRDPALICKQPRCKIHVNQGARDKIVEEDKARPKSRAVGRYAFAFL
jgi:hypothetical protein